MEWGYIDCSTLELDKFLPNFIKLLSPEQKVRASSFKTTTLRNFYIVRQGITLTVIAKKLDIPPEHVQLGYNQYSKPYVLTTPNFYFNTSSTKESLFIIALSQYGPCGIDIESIKPDPVRRLLSSEALSPIELPTFESLTPPQQIIAFYNMWVQKEACLKAFGTGFHSSPSHLELPVIHALPKAWPQSNPPLSFEGYELHLTQIQTDVLACLAATKGDTMRPRTLDIKAVLDLAFPV